MNKSSNPWLTRCKAAVFSAACLILFPAVANATPITISATGTVYSSDDSTNYFGLGTGANTMTGASIVTEFTFDTDDSGADLDSHPASLRHLPGIKWVSSTTVVSKGGVTLSLTPDDIFPVASATPDEILIQNEYGAGDGLGGLDSYFIEDKIDLGGGDEAYSQLHLYSYLDNIIASLDLDQVFSWTAGDSANDFGVGHFAIRSRGAGLNSVLDYELDTFTIAVSTSVPEPTILILLAIGLIGLGLTNSRRKNS